MLIHLLRHQELCIKYDVRLNPLRNKVAVFLFVKKCVWPLLLSINRREKWAKADNNNYFVNEKKKK